LRALVGGTGSAGWQRLDVGDQLVGIGFKAMAGSAVVAFRAIGVD
jgi:hypothetical protein